MLRAAEILGAAIKACATINFPGCGGRAVICQIVIGG
jgi:hypothetical protein